MIGDFRTARPSTLALAGFTFGLGVFCKQDYGAAMLLAVIAGLLAYVRSGLTGLGFWRLCGIFLLPAAGVGALAGLYFYWQGVLPDVIRFTVLNPFVGMATYEYTSYPPLLPLFVQDSALRSVVGTLTYMPAAMFTFDNQAVEQSWLLRHTAFYDTLVKLFFYLPYPVLLGGLYGLWKRRGSEGNAGERQRWLCEVLLFSFAASFILLVSLNKPQDYLHLAVLYAPLIWLGIVYLRRLAQSRPRLFWWAFLLAYVPLVTLTVYSGRLYWLLHSRNSVAVEGERAGVYVQPTEARFLVKTGRKNPRALRQSVII